MSMNSVLSAGLGLCVLGLVATSIQAAPAAGIGGAVDRDAARGSPVENVTWYGLRHCHWHYGYRHCWYGHRHYRPYHGYGYYRPYYGYYRPYYGYGHYHRYGHRHWW
jgi:hypothetical protein